MRPESNPSVILGFPGFVIKKLGKDFEKFFKQNFVFDGNVSIALLVLCDFHKNHFGFFFVNLILRNECSIFRTFIGEGHDMPKVFFPAVFGQESHGFKLGGIIKEDIPVMARYAEKEANPLYPVPKLMTKKELESFGDVLLYILNSNDKKEFESKINSK